MNRNVAAQVHQLPQHVLAALIPQHLDWYTHGENLRRELVRAALDPRIETLTWQDAWNRLTGATETRPGQLRLPPARCPECHGRRWSARAITRGRPSGICTSCNGNGRTRPVVVTALYARTTGQGG